ncbi:hypothetical protein PoB_001295500 [Plakobranchus ocellatus]|uniref:Uncharacterized protein n=1 Tax=Plakobranchus ocellatus TaxID=259542 RepID=A0AAV3YTE0_9GAST|nr:hypothetical protein PoB_001295500 [Plakobranchus ocellatus]
MQNRFFSFPAKTTLSNGKSTVSRSVRQEEHVLHSCAKDFYCVTPVKTLQVTTCLVDFIELGESLQRLAVPCRRTDLTSDRVNGFCGRGCGCLLH